LSERLDGILGEPSNQGLSDIEVNFDSPPRRESDGLPGPADEKAEAETEAAAMSEKSVGKEDIPPRSEARPEWVRPLVSVKVRGR
jgi:hypothetical protein